MIEFHNKININKGVYNKPMEIRLSLLNPDKIIKRSSGEVYHSGTINPNTLEPEEGGLFCNKIFKTNYKNNYICTVCSYRQNISNRCNRCGSNTRLDKSNTQNLSIGHITLASPVAHPWFLKTRVIHILCEGIDGIFEHKELNKLISTNPERIYQLFIQMNLLDAYFNLRKKLMLNALSQAYKNQDIQSVSNDLYYDMDYIKHKKIRIISSFIRLKQRPEWMFIKIVPVLSPTYRPLMRIDEKLFIASDINFLYQRVLERNNSYKKLLQRYSIQSFKQVSSQYLDLLNDLTKDNPVTRAKINLQKSVVTLIDSSFDKSSDKNKSKSVVRRLMGKEGRFRKDILGKRINFSGRTVITSGPRLHINQCGLPIEIALELFKPFILLKTREIFSYEGVSVQNKINENVKAIYRMIGDLINRHPILLNRAPTLHRLNIQAFSPLLIHTKAIQLHPLVCASFNADFDGDTMAIYIPHTIKSQVEARLLMMSSLNITSPATYEPIISPSQDTVFGIYYISVVYEGSLGEGRYFNDVRHIRLAIDNGYLNLHAPIYYLMAKQNKYVITTSGRVLIYHILTSYTNNIPFSEINKVLDKKSIVSFIKLLIMECGIKKTSLILDQIMSLGFYYAFKAGITFHKNDINVPNLKALYVQRTQKRVDLYKKETFRNITSKEDTSKKLLNEWSKCTTMLTNQLVKDIIHTVAARKSAIYMLIQSGARGSMVQMRQLCGLRGLMIKPSGDILDIPIVSNFKEGLSLIDYFNSTHGARKGVIDTSLKTAISGYLTRKLFYASKDLFIIENDCGTHKGILLGDIRFSNFSATNKTIYKDLIGRYIVHNITNPYTNEIILVKGTLVTEGHVRALRKVGIEYAIVRSPMTCESRNGICRKCYGSGVDNTKKVSLGESIGIIAAQSIGEPGTQLTMRTFHQGGTVLRGGSAHKIHASINARVLFFNKKYLKTHTNTGLDTHINIHRNSKLLLIDQNYNIQYIYSIPYGAILYVQDGQYISKQTLLFDWDPYTIPIISHYEGVVYLKNNNQFYNHVRDNISGLVNIATKTKDIHTKNKYSIYTDNISVSSSLMPSDIITLQSGSHIAKGSIIGYIRRNQRITQDITGGLSKISKLFECIQSQCSLVSPAEGFVVFQLEHNTSRLAIYIQTRDILGRWKYVRAGTLKDGLSLYVRENDYVYRGDILSDGIIPIRDLAEKVNFESSIYSLIDQIQSVYLENGVSIHQKHIEIILSQMYSKVANYEMKHIVPNKITHSKYQKRKIDVQNVQTSISAFKTKLRIYRYPKEYYYSRIISLFVMGLSIKKNKLSLTGISDVTYQSSSFLSSASFQKTSKVLTEAALWRGLDPLMGAQANLFFGYLMPIGTGTIRLYKDLYLKNNFKNYS